VPARIHGKSPIDLTKRIERNRKAAGGGASQSRQAVDGKCKGDNRAFDGQDPIAHDGEGRERGHNRSEPYQACDAQLAARSVSGLSTGLTCTRIESLDVHSRIKRVIVGFHASACPPALFQAIEKHIWRELCIAKDVPSAAAHVGRGYE
jgi:hypothetical protein